MPQRGQQLSVEMHCHGYTDPAQALAKHACTTHAARQPRILTIGTCQAGVTLLDFENRVYAISQMAPKEATSIQIHVGGDC